MTVVSVVIHSNTAETSRIKYNSDVGVDTSNVDGGSIFIIVPRLGGSGFVVAAPFTTCWSKVAILSISIDVIIAGMSMKLLLLLTVFSSLAEVTAVADCCCCRSCDDDCPSSTTVDCSERDDFIGSRAS
jgi:hypothetical protein